jgi:hypothetical protein
VLFEKFELGAAFRIGLHHLDRFDASEPDSVPAACATTTAWLEGDPADLG